MISVCLSRRQWNMCGGWRRWLSSKPPADFFLNPTHVEPRSLFFSSSSRNHNSQDLFLSTVHECSAAELSRSSMKCFIWVTGRQRAVCVWWHWRGIIYPQILTLMIASNLLKSVKSTVSVTLSFHSHLITVNYICSLYATINKHDCPFKAFTLTGEPVWQVRVWSVTFFNNLK